MVLESISAGISSQTTVSAFLSTPCPTPLRSPPTHSVDAIQYFPVPNVSLTSPLAQFCPHCPVNTRFRNDKATPVPLKVYSCLLIKLKKRCK